MLRIAALALAAASAFASNPADWVPARWNSTDPKAIALFEGTPVNCVLIEWQADRAANLAAFATAAAAKNIDAIAVIRPGPDPVAAARAAVRAKARGIALEGEFPENVAPAVRDALADTKTPVVEMSTRARLKLNSPNPVIGTYQGVWAGIQVTDKGKEKAGPSGSAWIDTNSGFLRALRAYTNAAIWLGNLPPEKTVITPERYMQMIGDAEMGGARWVIALDDDLAAKLAAQDASALKKWKRITEVLGFFESHPDWRTMQSAARLAIVQDRKDGALLSGGILDMFSAKHTPVQAVPPDKLSAEALKGKTMAVDVNSSILTPEQKDILTKFTRSGGTLLTGPPGWKWPEASDDKRITLDDAELKKIDDMWHDMQSMIGRRNLGARLFNVSSMLSNLLVSPSGKELYVELVNYADYPVDNVTVHVLGEFHHARLFTPDGKEKELEAYKNEEGTGVDIDLIATCATLRLN
jgi:hypothetical protein